MATFKTSVTAVRTDAFCNSIELTPQTDEKAWQKDCIDNNGAALSKLITTAQSRPSFTSAVYMTSTMAAAATVFALF